MRFEFTEDDTGGNVQAQVGDILSVLLAENATTGYRWGIDPVARLKSTKDTYVPGGSGIGAGGRRHFEFLAHSAGHEQLRLRLWRDWEGPTSTLKEFVLDVTIK